MQLIIICTVGALSIGYILFLILRSPKDKNERAKREYTEALNYLIDGNYEKALTHLRRSVQSDTENVDAYIKIGDLFREMGDVERASKVHLDLTVRENLHSIQQLQIFRSLVLDYFEAKKYEQALRFVEKLLEYNKNDEWTLSWKLKICEESRDWNEAFAVRKKLQKKDGKREKAILAIYRVELAKQLLQKGKVREGRMRLKEALKLDVTCVPAYLESCESYIREDSTKEAVNELRALISNVPQYAFLAFDRLKSVLIDKGVFQELEDVYETVLQKNPELEEGYVGLASLQERKGELYRAIELLRQAVQKNPDALRARIMLARLYQKLQKNDDAAKYAIEAIDRLESIKITYICGECGYRQNEPFWHCPQCGAWHSALTDF